MTDAELNIKRDASPFFRSELQTGGSVPAVGNGVKGNLYFAHGFLKNQNHVTLRERFAATEESLAPS